MSQHYVCPVTVLLETSRDLLCFSVTMVTVLNLAALFQLFNCSLNGIHDFEFYPGQHCECGVHTSSHVIVWGLVTQEGNTARLDSMM